MTTLQFPAEAVRAVPSAYAPAGATWIRFLSSDVLVPFGGSPADTVALLEGAGLARDSFTVEPQ